MQATQATPSTIPYEEWITVGDNTVYLTESQGDEINGIRYPLSANPSTWEELEEVVETRVRNNPLPWGYYIPSPYIFRDGRRYENPLFTERDREAILRIAKPSWGRRFRRDGETQLRDTPEFITL